MLEYLSIKDFVLIDSVFIEFGAGLNVLTGETGAGKSILIGALTFLLGGKTGAECVREGRPETCVSGSIIVPKQASSAREWLQERGVALDDDRILLRRVLRANGRSLAWIGDASVSRAEIEQFTSFLFDIHGQHEHQSLLKVSEHRRFLDGYAGLTERTRDFTRTYANLAEKKQALAELEIDEQNRGEKIELLRFTIDEISKANLKEGEDAELEREESRLSQFEKLFSATEQALELFGGDGVLAQLKRIKQAIEQCAASDPSLEAARARLENAYYELDDVADVLRQYRDTLTFDPQRLEEVEERLAEIFRLKKKYGRTIADILSRAQSAAAQLETLTGADENRAALRGEISATEQTLFKIGSELSEKRRSAARSLEKAVSEILRTLGMKDASFYSRVDSRPQNGGARVCGPYGFDDVEFMISSNAGTPARPLAKIASGGELSRVMLAIKTVVAACDEVDTMIFDEIDTGIGGEIALAVGAHLKKLTQNKQILCITHLASIAVRADTHIKIDKKVENGQTKTETEILSSQRREEEIARMLAGDAFDETALSHARELLERYGGRD